MIRFECERCGKLLAVPASKAGTVGACPGCKAKLRVPAERRRDEPGPARQTSLRGEDSSETFDISRSKLRWALGWYVCFLSLAFLVALGSPIGCVVILLNEQLSFQMVTGVAFAALVGVVGLCYLVMAFPNWRLFFASTVPSSSRYVVEDDRLVRYSRDDRVVEEVPFANVADVRMVTVRDAEDPEITSKLLGIDLRNLDDRGTLLDRQFCRWSQVMHRHDLVLIDDFFDVPLKTVYRKIKKRWEAWHEDNPGSAGDVDAPRRRKRPGPRAWYQNPLTYVAGGAGLAGVACLVVLLVLVMRNNGPRPAPPGPVVGPKDGGKPAGEVSGPKDLAGLMAYWPMDDGMGKEAAEASGKALPGRVHGGEWGPGVKGTALRLGGKGDHVELGAEGGLNFGAGGAFTLAAWVSTEANGGVIGSFRRRSSAFPLIEMSVRKGQLHGWVRDDTSGFGGAKVTGAAVNDGMWHHVALTRQPDGTIELFLDGASQGRDKGDASGGPITTDLGSLGCDRYLLTVKKAPPGFLAGNFDEVCVFNRALAAGELTALASRK